MFTHPRRPRSDSGWWLYPLGAGFAGGGAALVYLDMSAAGWILVALGALIAAPRLIVDVFVGMIGWLGRPR